MTKEQLQKTIFKEKADYCGFDFREELDEITKVGFTYEDFISDPNSIIISERYKNSHMMEDILVAIVRLMDKESINHVYTMNFGRITEIAGEYLNYQFLISGTSNGTEDLQVVFCHSKIDTGYYNMRGFNLPYFMIKSKEYGSILVFSSANGFVKEDETPFTDTYLLKIYNQYVYDVLGKNCRIRKSSYQYTSFLKCVNTDTFADGEWYNIQDVYNSIIDAAREYASDVEIEEMTRYREMIERLEEEQEIDKKERDRILKILNSYGKKYKRIPLRTNYTVAGVDYREFDCNDITDKKDRVELIKRAKEREKNDSINYDKLSDEDKELFLKFPNTQSIEILHEIRDLRKNKFPSSFSEGSTFIGIESSKTSDNITNEPNIFYLEFGIVRWITDEEAYELLKKETISSIVQNCSLHKRKYKFFNKYFNKDELYVSDINAYKGTITIIMGLKGDYHEL